MTVAFYGTFGGEVFMCALIKSLKIKKEDKEKEDTEDAG